MSSKKSNKKNNQPKEIILTDDDVYNAIIAENTEGKKFNDDFMKVLHSRIQKFTPTDCYNLFIKEKEYGNPKTIELIDRLKKTLLEIMRGGEKVAQKLCKKHDGKIALKDECVKDLMSNIKVNQVLYKHNSKMLELVKKYKDFSQKTWEAYQVQLLHKKMTEQGFSHGMVYVHTELRQYLPNGSNMVFKYEGVHYNQIKFGEKWIVEDKDENRVGIFRDKKIVWEDEVWEEIHGDEDNYTGESESSGPYLNQEEKDELESIAYITNVDWIKEARENHQAIDELYKEVEEGAMLFLARIQEDGIFNDFMEMVDAEEYTDEYMVNSDNAVVADECSELGEFIKQIKQNLYELDEYLMEQAQKDTITDEHYKNVVENTFKEFKVMESLIKRDSEKVEVKILSPHTIMKKKIVDILSGLCCIVFKFGNSEPEPEPEPERETIVQETERMMREMNEGGRGDSLEEMMEVATMAEQAGVGAEELLTMLSRAAIAAGGSEEAVAGAEAHVRNSIPAALLREL